MSQPTSTCSSKTIEQFLQKEMHLDAQAEFEKHLDKCDSCCDRLNVMTAATEQWADVAVQLSDAHDLGIVETDRNHSEDVSLDFLDSTDDPHMLGRFAGYEIVGVIGAGGMGIVLKGFDRALNRFIAIKVLKPHYASNLAARQRFAREARAAAAVVHDNVIAIHGVSVSGSGLSPADSLSETSESENSVAETSASQISKASCRKLPYLLMPYVRGESLQKRLDRCGPLSTAEVLRIAMQVARGLAAAHEQGLVHRDIKPANILLPEDVERVKITDFGLARAADDASLTRTGVIAGTPQYMSPEQALGEPITTRSDLFSLGSLMYVMCTGHVPFRGETPLVVLRRIVDENPLSIQEINSDVPDWLCEIISRLHAKSPDDRPQQAEEVATVLQNCLAHLQQPTTIPRPQTAFGRPLDTTPISSPEAITFKKLKGALAVIAVISIGLLGFFIWQTTPGSGTTPATYSTSAELASAREPQDATNSIGAPKPYEKEFSLAFAKPDEIGELNVDIKRGDIIVSAHEGKNILVNLTIPNFKTKTAKSDEGLSRIRANNPDFDINVSGNQIKLDSSANQYTTNLEIKVPRKINLVLDSYWDGAIKVSNVSGELNLRSQNNDISLTGISGSAKVYGYNGSLIASFDSVTKGKPLYFESYNGSVDVSLPGDFKATTKFRTKTGKLLTDFDVQLDQESVQSEIKGDGDIKIQFDKFVTGKINGGGPLLTIETEKGDIRLRKRDRQRELKQAIHLMHEPKDANSNADPRQIEQGDLDARMKIFAAVKSMVEKDQMPEYLLHASRAGVLEKQRELAIKQLEIEKVYKIDALLVLEYEKAIRSYEAMMENTSWRKRYPDMNIKNTAPYRRRLEFLRDELTKRRNPDADFASDK